MIQMGYLLAVYTNVAIRKSEILVLKLIVTHRFVDFCFNLLNKTTRSTHADTHTNTHSA